ncbi:MAG: hypothetical protein U9Q82_03730, partial [Chloroflexota bacterium]|nr:hypothetical protein [Chloroflexota bacterium]
MAYATHHYTTMTLRKRLIQYILLPSLVLVIITSGLIGAAPINPDSTNLKGTVAFATIAANA